MALLNQSMNYYHDNSLSPPKSQLRQAQFIANSGGLPSIGSPQIWGARGAKRTLNQQRRKIIAIADQFSTPLESKLSS